MLSLRASSSVPYPPPPAAHQDFTGNSIVPTPDDIRGGISCIIWLITGVVCVKYLGCIMTTSLFHHGEVGGTAFRSLLKYLHNALATDGACGGPLPGVAQLV